MSKFGFRPIETITSHILFREVYKARDRESGKLVALKKVRMENEKEGVSLIPPSPRS